MRYITYLRAHTDSNFAKRLTQVMPYGNVDLGQYWLSWWFIACWHLGITWFNVDLSSMGFSDTHLRPISKELFKISIRKMSLKYTLVKKVLPVLLGGNELTFINLLCWKLPWLGQNHCLRQSLMFTQWETETYISDEFNRTCFKKKGL